MSDATAPPVPVADSPRVLQRLDLPQVGELLAIHKPANLRIHPASDDGHPDLVGWLDAQTDIAPGTRPIHRLDGPASGLVLCAAEAAVRATVSGWLAGEDAHRTYVALVHGRTRKKGIVRRPLQDQRRGRPLPAVTRYRRIDWIGAFTLVQITPETGRKHQIRRHLHGLGHPLVGDTRYKTRRFRAVPGFPERLWLHALAIGLPDLPIIEAPLAPELEAHLAYMQQVRRD